MELDRRQIFWGVAQARVPGQRLHAGGFPFCWVFPPFSLSFSSFFLLFFLFSPPPPAARGEAESPARGAGRGAGGAAEELGRICTFGGRWRVLAAPAPRTPEISEVRLRGPRACRRADCLMWYRGPCRGEWFRAGGKKKRFFSSLKIGIVMVLDYFTGGVNIACYPVYLLKISV